MYDVLFPDQLDPNAFQADVNQVRALYGDVAPDENGDYILSEAVLFNILKSAKGNILYAASLACGTIAADELMLSKVLRTDDLTINGAAAAAEWRLRAQNLYEQYRSELKNDWDTDFFHLPNTTPF